MNLGTEVININSVFIGTVLFIQNTNLTDSQYGGDG
jgi:hypothetical protein